MTRPSTSRKSVESNDNATYETLAETLEEIVRRLEEDGLSLDGAVAAYEDGMRLIQQCNELLDKAELRVTELAEEHRRAARNDDEVV